MSAEFDALKTQIARAEALLKELVAKVQAPPPAPDPAPADITAAATELQAANDAAQAAVVS